MTLRLTIFFLFLLPFSLSAQKKMKFGKIPSEDLKMTVYEQDTSAAAVVLDEKGRLDFEFSGEQTQIRLDVHRRIKILKRSGFDQGDISLPYYSGNRGNITGIKVKVFNPDGSEQSLKNSDIFDEKLSDNYSAKKFSVPGLKEGSIIEYKYSHISGNIFSLRRWFFQEDIPVRFSEYVLKIPEWYNYVKLMTGNLIQEEQISNTNETITYNKGGAAGGRGEINLNFITTMYSAENLPAMKEESFVTTMEDYYTNIQFQLSSVNYPYSPIENILTSWEKVAKEMLEASKFGNQFLKKIHYSKILTAAEPDFAGLTTDLDKIKAAYDFVLNNMEWNENYSVYASENLNQIFQKKSGRSADLNLTLLALLKAKGISAEPVLISTRDNGKMIDVYPILSQFNHVIILAEADGKQYFLDATEKNRPIGFPEANSLNKRGWLVSKEHKWINIETPKSGDVFMTNLTLDDEGNLTGDFSASCSGYSGFDEREIAKGDKEGKYWQKRLGEFNSETEIMDISYEGMDKNDKNMKARMNCTIPEAAQVNGDFIYLSPIVYTSFDENPFKLETRSYPVEISHPFKEQLIVNITIPEGYTIEELPEQINLALPNKGIKYQYFISQNKNILQIIWKISIKQLQFSPEEYKGVKNFFDIIMEKKGEQIVLKKI